MSTTTRPLPGTTFDPFYPDSDGKPMGESGFHVAAIIHLHTVLTSFFRTRNDVFVGADMFVYYEQGNREAQRAPDVFVAIGVAGNHQRRSFRLWEELVPPTIVIEVTSKSTFDEDDTVKPLVYARLGVAEYFLFDPDGEELDPPVKGRRLHDGSYEPILPDAHGRLQSQELGLFFEVDGPLLRAIDAHTGQRLMTYDEIADAQEQSQHHAEEAEHRAVDAERQAVEAREQAEAQSRRAAALEAELARLRGGQGT